MLNHDEQVALLIRRGLMPSDAEEIVSASAARGQRLRTYEELVARFDMSDAAIENAKAWTWISNIVPAGARRLPTARQIP